MTFGAPWWLWSLAGVAVFALVLIAIALGRRGHPGARVRWPRIARVAVSRGAVRPVAPGRGIVRPWLLLLATSLTIVALARPRWGRIDEPALERAREVMIALDLSRSMLVTDVPPARLERARLLTQSLLDGLRGERVGLIVFAGTAFVQVPLSADYQILHEFLPELNPAYMPQGGTDFAGMLRAALGGFSRDAQTDRFLIVLSDGESQSEDWRALLGDLKERGIRVLALGIGTTAGGFIPDGHGSYVKDSRGAVVLSRLEPATLQALARETQGAYRNASEWVDLRALLEATVALGRRGEFTTRRTASYIERFQWFLAPAVVLGLLGLWREIPVRPRQQTIAPARSPRPEPARDRRSAAPPKAIPVAGMVLVFSLLAADLPGADSDAPPAATNDPAARVRETIARLAVDDSPSALDWRELADRTLVYGTGARMNQQPLEPGVVLDAIEAVDRGQQANPSLADWDKLRNDLRALLETPPEEKPPEPPPQENQEQQEQEQQQQQQEQNRQQPNPSGNGSGQQDQQQQEQEQPPPDQTGPDEQQPQQNDQAPPDAPPPQSSGNPDEQPQDTKPRTPQNTPAESRMGELKDPVEEPPPSARPRQEPKTRQIGGRRDASPPAPTDAETAMLLQRLREATEQDSPAQLFQLLERENEQPANRGQDW